MKKVFELKPKFVEYMPEKFEHGILYISIIGKIAIHLCACGCGEQTVTPLDDEDGWKMSESDGKITLLPSIGNFEFPCKSHYYITNNNIQWL